MSWAVNDPTNGWVPVGDPMTMSIVGIYRPADAHERYWGSENFFTASATSRGVLAPVLTSRGTILAIDHAKGELQSVDSFVIPSKVTAANIGTIRATVARMLDSDRNNGPTYSSKIPVLLDRMDQDRSAAVTAISLAVIPLLLLACFVLFLVIAYGLQERRIEVGMVRLRGVKLLSRWWLAVGEIAIPVLVAIPIGYATGIALTAIATTATVDGSDTVVIGPLSREFLFFALVAMVVAIVAAHQRTLAARVAELLRNVPTRAAGWRTASAEIGLIALAVVALIQMHSQTGPLSGVSLLAPGLVIAAIAVIAGRFVPVLARRIGARALGAQGKNRKVRLGLGVGALQLARRPGAQRVMTVHVFAIGLLALTASAAIYQHSAQQDQVKIQIGAPRVLNLAPLSRNQLINAVHAVDPQGKFAMLTMVVQGDVPKDPPLLAVDSSRLAAVATWPDHSVTAAAAAAALQPGVIKPLIITGTRFQLTASARNFDPGVDFRVRVQVVPLDGGDPTSLDMGGLQEGEKTYATPNIDICKNGCRVAGIGVLTGSPSGQGATVTIEGMRTLAPTPGDVDLQLGNADLWQPTHPTTGNPPLLSPGVQRIDHDGRRLRARGPAGCPAGLGQSTSPGGQHGEPATWIARHRQQALASGYDYQEDAGVAAGRQHRRAGRSGQLRRHFRPGHQRERPAGLAECQGAHGHRRQAAGTGPGRDR